MTEHWWRAYDGSIDHPKLLRLSDAMHRAWYTLQCIASANGGVLPPTADIALRLRMKPSKVAEWITTLVYAELLDNDAGVFVPHNWDTRQYKSDATDPTAPQRMKRYRENKRNERNATVTVIRPETETETETETEQKKETRDVALSFNAALDFAEFWDEWPNKVGKPAAVKAFASAKKRGAILVEILTGVRAYIRDKPPDRSWLNPATFLNQNRWEDQPALVQHNEKPRSAIIQAAGDLRRKLAGFDGPAREPDELRGGEGGTPVRLLSHG